MGHTVDHMDDFVVDMVLEVDSRGIGVEDLARRIAADLEAVRREAFTESVRCFGVSIDSTTDAPDPGASRPRRRLNAAATFLHHGEGD